jgi:hypothetical protein
MKIKFGTTQPEFLGFECQFSRLPIVLAQSLEWSLGGYTYKDSAAAKKVVIETSSQRKSLTQLIDDVTVQGNALKAEERKNLNVIFKVSATCPNTLFVITSHDLAFFRKHNASLLIEVWESSVSRLEGADTADAFNLDPGQVYASLRIAANDLEPQHITDILKIEPTNSFCANDINQHQEKYGFGKWSVSTENTKLQSSF